MVSVSQVTSPGSIPLDVIRLPGVSRLESVWAASAAQLSVDGYRVWQDKSGLIRTHHTSIATHFRPTTESAVARHELRSLPAPQNRYSGQRCVLQCLCVLAVSIVSRMPRAPG